MEAGLGRGVQEYLTFQLHTFPASRSARTIWGGKDSANEEIQTLIQQPAYQALAKQGVDDCGLVTLAQRTVGTPFVGVVASTLVIAEALRLLHGGSLYEVMDGDLRAPDMFQAHRSSSIPPCDNRRSRFALVIRRFAGDRHIVRVTLDEASRGDMDVGGLRILAHLRSQVEAIRPLGMEADIFERHRAYAQPLTQRERDSLLALASSSLLRDCFALMDAMLVVGQKLEQEAIRPVEVLRHIN